MTTYRILVTGSREWTDKQFVREALQSEAALADESWAFPVLVHGAAAGLDVLAHYVWTVEMGYEIAWQSYPADDFPDPKARNQHMVDLGADVCLAFAKEWASGTGHCARAARKAGIPTIDYGVSTE